MSDITKWSSYESIATLDPLGFDEHTADLPLQNTGGNVGVLTETYRELLDRADGAIDEGLDTDNAVASLRDLDFVAGSLLRHGATSVAEQDRAQKTLMLLGNIAGTVPRGTVYTYAACNPTGNRRRSFTGSQEEELFVDAVTGGINALDICMDDVLAAAKGDVARMSNANNSMGKMITAIVTVMRGVTPEYFTHQMRPYFDGITIDGDVYAGPGGAQMQVVALDRLLWGAGCPDAAYQEYFADNVRYLTPNQRADLASFESEYDNRSIIDLIKEGLVPLEAVPATRGLLQTLRRFRYPHRKVAADNFALRSSEAVGSGQYTPTMLDALIRLNDSAIAELDGIAHE